MTGRLAYVGGHGYPTYEVLKLAAHGDKTWTRVQRSWDGANWTSYPHPFYLTLDTRALRDYPFERTPDASPQDQPSFTF